MNTIQYMSDIHVEFGPIDIPVKAPILVLAGDVHVGEGRLSDFLNEQAKKFEHVIFVYGNHEFYHHDYKVVRELTPTFVADNVHILDRDEVTIDGQHFIGATLWANDCEYAFSRMNDSRIISSFNYTIMQWENWEDRAYIQDNVTEDSVVITHHAPSVQSIDISRYGEGPMNEGYYTPILEDINTVPKLWICGHTHRCQEYEERGCTVVANQRGYVGYDEVADFDIEKTREI